MEMFKKLIIVNMLFLFLFCGKHVEAEQKDNSLVLIVIPHFSFQEVTWLKNHGQYAHLWTTGGMSGMNIRPEGPYSYLNNTVSLSSGVRGLGVEDWNAYEQGEVVEGVVVEELYQQWTGDLIEEGTLFHPHIHRLVDKNKNTTYRAQIGILGQELKEHGVDRFVIGNSDLTNEKVRYAPLFTMDSDGLTNGFLLEGTKKSVGSPSGRIMDVDNIFQVLSSIKGNQQSFIVIEWGDLFRLFNEKVNMTSTYFNQQYEWSLLNLELFVQELLTGGHTKHLIMLSPMVHSDAYQNKEQLAPFFYWQTDFLGESFYLNSDTTRQDFVISNLDIVPTIFNFFGIDETERLLGKQLKTVVTSGSLLESGLKKLHLMFSIYKTRNVVLSSYITILVLLLILVSVIIILKDKKELWINLAKILLVSGLSSPLWLLLTPYVLNYFQPNMYLLLLIFCSYLSGYLLVKYTPNPILFISFVLFVAISFDLFIGNFFMKRSYLGYDPVIGARYYGIGNEFAGIYLASGLLLLQQRKMRKWLALSLLAFGKLAILSSSNLGANAGATLSAGIMFGFFYYRHFFRSFQWRKLFFILSLIVPFVLAVMFFAQLNGKESHIGYAFSKLFHGDITYIIDTIKRKLQMNWKIFRYSNWTQLFVTTYLIIALYLWRGKNIVQDRIKQTLIQTGVVASIALLLLNDSGVVAAATSMFIIVCTSYYWALEESVE